MTIDTTNMCSHLQKGRTCDVDNIVGGYQLFEEDGIYHHLWLAMQDDPELTAVVRSRQLHTVAAACGFELQNHHHALADAEACATIALYIL